MKGKAALLVGAGIGYVLGARAGQERYEKIKAQAGSTAQKVRRDPRVQQGVEQAKQKGTEAAETAKDQAADAAQTAKHKGASVANGGSASTTGSPGSPASSARDPRA